MLSVIFMTADNEPVITIHPTEENGGLVNSWVADTLYQAAAEAGVEFPCDRKHKKFTIIISTLA